MRLRRRGRRSRGRVLVVKIVPVVMHCPRCDADVELDSLQSFRCPRCGDLVGDLRQGRELEIESFEIDGDGRKGGEIGVNDDADCGAAAGDS
jgi:Zn finger protein HypA/HybF involved in hydrogenase expression